MTDLSSDIVAALRADPLWDEDEKWVEYYTQLPEVLKDRLDHPVTMQEVLTCGYLWVKFLLDKDAPSSLYTFLNTPELKGLESLFGDPAARLRRRLQSALPALTLFADGKATYRSEWGERDSLVEYGLTGSALRAYDQGRLTIKDLLRSRPTVVAPRY